MTDNLKRKTLAFLLLTVIVTVVIAAALPQLELKSGIPLPFQEGSQGTLPANQTPQVSISISTFLKALLVSSLVLVLAYGGYKLLKGVPWKEILLPVLVIATLTLVVLAILFSLVNVQINFELHSPEILPPAVNIKLVPPDSLPPCLIWLVWGGFAVGMVLLGIWLIHRPTRQARPGDPLELEAERAKHALKSGLDLKDVIVRCYLQMSQTLQKEQGIELEETMTAREFERLLIAGGFPHTPVHQLTQLFETSRYGHQKPGPGDEQKAFDCLNTIVQHSRERRGSN